MQAIIKSSIDSNLKAEVEQVLASLGMTVNDVVRITFAQIAARKGLPFDVKLPNVETLNALEESDQTLARLQAGDKPRFNSLDDYFAFMEQVQPNKSQVSKKETGKIPAKPKAAKRVAVR